MKKEKSTSPKTKTTPSKKSYGSSTKIGRNRQGGSDKCRDFTNDHDITPPKEERKKK